jgi:anti-sigma factor RsiW
MNDDHFFDLAMKVIARQATEAERAELDALVARQPDLKAEFERLQADVRLAREVLPLISATEATAPELPAYARGRLQTKVRETLGRPSAPKRQRKTPWGRCGSGAGFWAWLPQRPSWPCSSCLFSAGPHRP